MNLHRRGKGIENKHQDPCSKEHYQQEEDLLWSDGHHCSAFMPGLGDISNFLERFSSQIPSPPLQMPILTHEVFSEGNLSNITQQCLSTSPLNRGSSRIFMWESLILPKRFKYTLAFSANSEMFSRGLMTRFLGSIHVSLCTKFPPILVRSLCTSVCTQCILRKPML